MGARMSVTSFHPSRLVVVYGLARSGSTYVEKAITQYLQQHYGHRPASELFNLNLPVDWSNGELVIDREKWHPAEFSDSITIEQSALLRKERLAHVLAGTTPLSIKLLGFHLPPPLVYQLLDQSSVVFVKRENLWENLLSYLISFQTMQFYPAGGVKWEDGSLVADKKYFSHFQLSVQLYLKLRELYRTKSYEVSFEKFLQDGGAYMSGLGFSRPFDWSQVAYPPRDNTRPKEIAFSNIDELRGWYRRSALQQIFGI